jgi:hypothetical protein
MQIVVAIGESQNMVAVHLGSLVFKASYTWCAGMMGTVTICCVWNNFVSCRNTSKCTCGHCALHDSLCEYLVCILVLTIAVSTATVTSEICPPDRARNSSVSVCTAVYFKLDVELTDSLMTISDPKKLFQLWWVPWRSDVCVKFYLLVSVNCRDSVLPIK